MAGTAEDPAMKSDYIVAGILVGAMVVGVGAYSAHPGDEYCPSPSAASVAKLFAPCQVFDAAMGREVSKQESVQPGLLTPDDQPFPASQVASADGGARVMALAPPERQAAQVTHTARNSLEL
jgi:hypothetical protein